MRRGFTLVEVLLAAVLGAVITLAVAQVLWVTRRAAGSVSRRADARGLGLAVERRLRADLLSIVPPGGLHASGVVGTSAEGAGTAEDLVPAGIAAPGWSASATGGPPLQARDQLTLAVLGAPPAFGRLPALGEGALLQVIWRIDDDPGTPERGLVREVLRVRDLAPGAEAPPPEPVAEEVVGLDLFYFDGETWTETWDSGASDTLPALIRVRLALLHEQELSAEELLISPPTSRAGAIPEALQ